MTDHPVFDVEVQGTMAFMCGNCLFDLRIMIKTSVI